MERLREEVARLTRENEELKQENEELRDALLLCRPSATATAGSLLSEPTESDESTSVEEVRTEQNDAQMPDAVDMKMARPGRKLPVHLVDQIRALCEARLSAQEISTRVEVSKRTVERMRESFGLFGLPYAPAMGIQGRPRALTVAQEEWVLNYVNNDPSAHFDDVAVAVQAAFDVDISAATVRNILKRRSWSRNGSKPRVARLSKSAVR